MNSVHDPCQRVLAGAPERRGRDAERWSRKIGAIDLGLECGEEHAIVLATREFSRDRAVCELPRKQVRVGASCVEKSR